MIYCFLAKKADRIKLIWRDDTGLCLMAKKLEQGGFRWLGIRDGVMRRTTAQLGVLLGGLTGAGCMAGVVPEHRNSRIDALRPSWCCARRTFSTKSPPARVGRRAGPQARQCRRRDGAHEGDFRRLYTPPVRARSEKLDSDQLQLRRRDGSRRAV